MGTEGESANGESTTVSTHVSSEFVEKFDRALKRAQIDGEIPMDVSRAEALRRLMRKGIQDPSLFSEEN